MADHSHAAEGRSAGHGGSLGGSSGGSSGSDPFAPPEQPPTGQAEQPPPAQAGCAQPAYGQPGGYAQPAYRQPGGYAQPAYAPPPSGQPGYAQPAYGQAGYGTGYVPGYDQPGYGYPAQSAAPRNGLGLASMILGIVGLVFFWTIVVGVVLGALAVVFGLIGMARTRRREATNRGQAVAGLVTGAIALILVVLFIVLLVAAGDGTASVYVNS